MMKNLKNKRKRGIRKKSKENRVDDIQTKIASFFYINGIESMDLDD